MSCSAAPGGWNAAGTVHNSLGKNADYKITVFFIDKQATVIGYTRTSVRVATGQKVSWHAAGKFNAVPGTNCVLRGVAASAG